MANMMVTAEKALRKRTNKMLATATKRYRRFMGQAAKAANAHKREQYLAAALGALILTGVAANELKTRMDAKKASKAASARKMSSTKKKRKTARRR
jgi:hypothetical protein